MNYWRLIHNYRRLVTEERAAPLLCPDCKERLGVRLGKDDDPMLYCAACDSKFYIGADVWDQIRAVVSEWVLEEDNDTTSTS
jgi:hypothetical protein